MNQSQQTSLPFPEGQRIAFIKASWHRDIVDQSLSGFQAELARQAIDPAWVDVFTVPGAFEIPLHAQRLARSGKYAAIVGAALVVDGGIYRHDFVAPAVVDALMRIQLDTDVPTFSVVLTPHHFHEHDEHERYFFTHFVKKGEEAASAVLETVAGLAVLPV